MSPACAVCGAPDAHCLSRRVVLCATCALVACELTPDVLEARARLLITQADILTDAASMLRGHEGAPIPPRPC